MPRFALALVAFTGFIATAHADVYKSIDAQGQVHYSDQWSPGAQLIKSDRPLAGVIPPPAAPPPVAASDPTKAASKQVQADMTTVRAEQCKELKDQYDKMIHARRIYQSNADSSAPRQYMTDAEADAERVKTRQAMDEACAGSGG